MNYVGVDLHKEQSWFYVMDEKGNKLSSKSISNEIKVLKEYFKSILQPFKLAVESTYNWYFFVDLAQQYADKFCKLTILANEITRDLDPKNELLVFRVKANKQEILVAPKYEPDGTPKFHIVAVQSLNSGSAM